MRVLGEPRTGHLRARKKGGRTTYSPAILNYLNEIGADREIWLRRNRFYHRSVLELFREIVPEGASVLHVGAETGALLAGLKPSRGIGVEPVEALRSLGRAKYPHLHFQEAMPSPESGPFDYVILSDGLGRLEDIQSVLKDVHKLTGERTRVVVAHFNYLWEPLLRLTERLGLRMRQPDASWLSLADVKNLLDLTDYRPVRVGRRVLLPAYVPVLSAVMNRILARLPVLQHLCLLQFVVAYPHAASPAASPPPSCSVIVPCRNERGNIGELLRRLPALPGRTEVIFVEGGSSDGTRQEIERLIKSPAQEREVKLLTQTGVGKADAVRLGFAHASRDVLMILDADLSVQPEDLPKFYWAVVTGKARLAIGCRLVYPMERRSMQFANVLGNKLFASVLSWIIDQPIKDALCGTKVLFRSDLQEVMQSSERLRIKDPFGDFDLIFGAANANLSIREIPIRYRERTYGTTNIRRWYHGMVLLRLTWQAIVAFKFSTGRGGHNHD